MQLNSSLVRANFRRTKNARRKVAKRWVAWGFAVAMLPAIGFAAYMPNFLIPSNNLSDLTSASSARTNLGLGTAATHAASDFLLAANNLSDVTASTARTNLGLGSFATLSPGTLTNGDWCTYNGSNIVCTSAAPAVGITYTLYTSNTASVTLANTTNLIEAIKQGTPAALTINLNATTPAAGQMQCVKDVANTFATNNATVKTTDSSTIDGVAGATGFVMNQNKQYNCFVYDGTSNWSVI